MWKAVFVLLLASGQASAGPRFSLCAQHWQADCVVDGDTLYVAGVDVRLVDIDAPEISKPKCAQEFKLGLAAQARLLQLVNSATVSLRQLGRRDHDRFGRKLRLVLVNGIGAGETLVSEGLAARWEGRHHRWCR